MHVDRHLLVAQLIRHEGMRLRLYQCPAGKTTIGVGRNLEANGIREAEALFMLKLDIAEAEHAVRNLLHGQRISLDSVIGPRFDALVNVCFNIGPGSLRGFKRMFAAIRAGDWDQAGAELLNSRYAIEVGQRAYELAAQLILGEYGET